MERWFSRLGALDLDAARACWHPDARWRLQDRNAFGGDYSIDEYLTMLGEFFTRYGTEYAFRVDDIATHGDLVVVFAGSTQPELGSTDAVMIFRVRDGLIAEGWGIGHGADSTGPW